MRKKIIVVEDHDDIREIIGMLLRAEDYNVHLYENAVSFRQEIFEQKPDMVIFDVMLPDGNGIDLCCEVKSDNRTSHIPVLMMSANSSLSEIRKRCEADDFIQKPFDINSFMNRVGGLIERQLK